MTLPETFVVGPWTMQIVRDDAALYSVSTENSTIAVAGNRAEEGKVWLREDETLTDDSLRVDLLHEVMHLCFDFSGTPSTSDEMERVIDVLAIALLTTLRNPRNALLRRFFFED